MEGFRDTYLRKCADLACKPIEILLADLDVAIQQGATLTRLALNGSRKELFSSRVQPMQVLSVCEALQSNTSFEVLDLTNNFLNDLAAQAVGSLIKSEGSSIQSINLAGNSIGPQGAATICGALCSPSCKLQALSLSSNPLGEEGMLAVGEMLRSNTSLRALDVSNVDAAIKGLLGVCNAMGAEGGDAGPCNSTLEALDIGAHNIHVPQDTITLSLARMLANNSTLTELGLSKHKMVDSQLETLVTYGFLRNKSITSLDLRANRLSGFSGAQLERLLSEASQLTQVNLSANMLSDAGALALARSMPYCHWLTSLDLRGNNIGEQGLVALAEALSMSPHMQVLLIWGNPLGPASSRAFADALATLEQHRQQANGESAGSHKLIIDVQPYEVDGRAQLAFVQVD